MNTSTLKSFAPEVRRQLMEAVERKLDFVLTGDTADLRAAQAQVAKLREEAEENRSVLIERVAYTWFNRLAALRYFDARGWHPFRARVLMPATSEETQPELLKLTRTGSLPEELMPFTDPDRLNDLLDGRLPSGDPQGEVYRHLILASCRFYHDLLPFLFERLDDETELLLPDDLLTEHSITQGFRTQITDEDCSEVEILGWLYQFYISEKKNQVMARKKAVPTEDIPAVTQLFTPHWIVRYLVENSLGRLWLNSRPGSKLKEHMSYYVDDPEGQKPADSLTVKRPEEINLLDPACGSGHMLTYSFDLLYRIYEEEGYAPTDIPEKILTHNLYGLEICPRATQLSQLALICKAREKTRTAFSSPTQPQVMCLEDVPITSEEMKAWIDATGLNNAFDEKALKQVHQFRKNTSTFGSLIKPILTEEKVQNLRNEIEARNIKTESGDILLTETHRKVIQAINQAEMLTMRYHVVVANPPYMGSGGMDPILKKYCEENYSIGKHDLYACFILRNLILAVSSGLISMITIPNWMFLTSYEQFRHHLLGNETLISLIENGRGVWGSDFGSCQFCFQHSQSHGTIGKYKRLYSKPGEVNSNIELVNRFKDNNNYPFVLVEAQEFEKVPQAPIAFWISPRLREAFSRFPIIDGRARKGLTTADNQRFVRNWHELSKNKLSLHGGDKWFPMTKGGDFRKWYGNNEYMVDWEKDGFALRSFVDDLGRPKAVLRNTSYYLQQGITWNDVSMSYFSARYIPEGYICNAVGPMIYGGNVQLTLGMLNSKVNQMITRFLCPSVKFEVGAISSIPVKNEVDGAEHLTESAISLARTDWDNYETSWDFTDLPLLRDDMKGSTLSASWQNWEFYLKSHISRMQELETENNRLWIEAYGLEDELEPEVPEEEITLARPDRKKDVAVFLSYAVGCMMGRYSLDKEGLILADAADTLENYLTKVGRSLEELTFTPDEDGIIPVLDGEWFEDDIVARTRDFLRVTFGEDTLEDNLRFIEESLGKELRKYYLTDFYKNHYSNERAYGYKKRPIYWMFQSPKKGFMCLIYLHRYNRDTANTVLNRYLREYLHKLRSRIENLDYMLASESTPSREKTKARKESEQLKKTLRECEEWERDTLLPLAQQRIELDLDDGVKVNYPKLGKALAPIPGLVAKEGEG